MDVETIRQVIDDRLRRVNTCLPGRIESYDALRREADIAPDIDDIYSDGTTLKLPVLTGVPVLWMATATAGLVLPLAVGDRVLVLFAQRSIDRWLSTGNREASGDARMHAMSDAIAIAGLFPFNVAHNDGAGAVFFNGAVKVRLNGGKVGIGTSGTELLDKITDALDDIATSTCPDGAPLSKAASIQSASNAIKTIQGSV